jgi:hypothetical protein
VVQWVGDHSSVVLHAEQIGDPNIATARITAYHIHSINGLEGHGYTFPLGPP